MFGKLNPFRKKTKITDSGSLLKIMTEQGSSYISKDTATKISAVFSCATIIAESIGMLPLSIYEKTENGRDRVKGKLHYLLTIAPNDWMTAQEFKEMMGYKLAIFGNFYALKTFDAKGELIELLPINGRVVKKQSTQYEIWYEVTINGKTTRVEKHFIFHVMRVSKNGLTGMTPIEESARTFNVAVHSDNLGEKFLTNASRPAGVLVSEANLTTGQLKEYSDLWNEKYGGENNFRTAILGNGFKYQSTMIPAGDLQYLESKKFNRAEIAGLFRIPPHMIGDLENSHHSNMEQQGQEFVTHCLMPYLTKIESRVVVDLIEKEKRLDQYAKFNVGALVRGDMAARGQFYTQLVQNGALSPNEIRELEDRPPRKGGDIYLTPMNMLINGENLNKGNSHE